MLVLIKRQNQKINCECCNFSKHKYTACFEINILMGDTACPITVILNGATVNSQVGDFSTETVDFQWHHHSSIVVRQLIESENSY